MTRAKASHPKPVWFRYDPRYMAGTWAGEDTGKRRINSAGNELALVFVLGWPVNSTHKWVRASRLTPRSYDEFYNASGLRPRSHSRRLLDKPHPRYLEQKDG